MKKGLIAASSMAMLAAAPSFAENTAKDSIQLQAVEVTCFMDKSVQVGKLPVQLSKAPMSAGVMDNLQFDLLGVTTLNEATRNLTGIRPNNTYGGFMKWTMRGFDNFVLLNDGVRDERHNLYDSAPSTNLAGIERIELLKGANSVTVGSAALGGVLNIVHKQPTAASTANAKMTIGSWGRYGIEAGAGGEIVKGINFRADAGMTGGEGWRHTDNKAYNLSLTFDFHINPNDLLQLSFHGKDDFYGTDTGTPIVQNDVFSLNGNLYTEAGSVPEHISRRTRFADPLDALKDKDMQLALKWDHDFNNDWKFSDRFSYYYDDLSYYATEKLTYNESAAEAAGYKYYYMKNGSKQYIDLDNIKRAGFKFDYNVNLIQNTAEVSGKFTSGSIKHNVLGGYTYSWMYTPRYQSNYNSYATGDGKNSIVSAINPILNQGNIILPFHQRNLAWEQTHGIYVQDFLKFTDKLSGVASLRYDFYNRTYQKGVTDRTDGIGKTVTSKTDKQSVNRGALSYRAGLVYQFNENANVYATTSNYFNFRPVRTQAADGYIYLDNKGNEVKPSDSFVYSPESGFLYEIGSHLNWGSKFNANIALYWITKSNMIQSLGSTQIDGQTYTVSGQVGKAESKGVELDFQYNPCSQFIIEGGYTYCNAKVRENADNKYALNAQKGNYLAHVPEHSGFGWAYYMFPAQLRGLTVGLGFNASSRVYVNTSNAVSFDPYFISNAMLGYSFKRYDLKMHFNNLADKTYYMTSVNTIGFIPEEGFNVRFTAAVKF